MTTPKEIIDKQFKEIQEIAYGLGVRDTKENALNMLIGILNRMPVYAYPGYRTDIGDEFRKLMRMDKVYKESKKNE